MHIPFCQSKCNYCDFLSAASGEQERKEYVEALCREIRAEGEVYGQKKSGEASEENAGYPVDTLFFGGGTPSLLSEEEIQRIMGALRESFFLEPTAEITLEVNPGTVDLKKLKTY